MKEWSHVTAARGLHVAIKHERQLYDVVSCWSLEPPWVRDYKMLLGLHCPRATPKLDLAGRAGAKIGTAKRVGPCSTPFLTTDASRRTYVLVTTAAAAALVPPLTLMRICSHVGSEAAVTSVR